jgi:two-component system sensor histidine kinase KdpD
LCAARTALLLAPTDGRLVPHPAGSLLLAPDELAVAETVRRSGRPAGRFTDVLPTGRVLHLPLRRGNEVVGVFSVNLGDDLRQLSSAQRELLDGFAAQIALLVERESLRAAGEREKILAESDRLHRTLLDSVSHELKTPLSVLRTAAEKLDTDDARKRASLVGEVRTATSRLDHLVANLLNQTRLESGSLQPQPDWCDARDLVASARRAVGEALARHTLRIELPEELPLLRCDAALMEQVLANLLLNAAHHTPPGGVLRVHGGADAVRGQVFMAVSDNGPGIAPELHGSLFQKFSRGPQARAGGLGLGLSIVRGFMLAQGGDVTASRSAEGGACFTVHLPLADPGLVPNDEH